MRNAAYRKLTVDLVRQLVSYDDTTGHLTWNDRPRDPGWSSKFAGERALISPNTSGYLSGRLLSIPVRVHQVVWLLVHGAWPDGEIDHINGDRTDNRLANLRLVTRAENNRNTARRSDNRSGVTGVSWDAARGKWVARIKGAGKYLSLGRFDTVSDAMKARGAAVTAHGYHKNHGRIDA